MSEEINYDEVIDGQLFKWEKEGATINGILQSYQPKKDTGKGPGHLYEVKTKQGVAAFFAPQLLHKKLQGVPVGSIVKIVYTHMSKTAVGNTLKHFTVGHAVASEANLKALGVEAVKYNNVADEEARKEKEFNEA